MGRTRKTKKKKKSMVPSMLKGQVYFVIFRRGGGRWQRDHVATSMTMPPHQMGAVTGYRSGWLFFKQRYTIPSILDTNSILYLSFSVYMYTGRLYNRMASTLRAAENFFYAQRGVTNLTHIYI